MSCTNSFAVAPSYKPVRQCTGDCCRLTPSYYNGPVSETCNNQEGAFWVEAWKGVPGASGSTGISAVSLSLCDSLQFYTFGNMLLDVNSGSAQVSINANNIISGAGAPTSSPPTTAYPFLYYDNTDASKVYIWSVTTKSWTQITGAGGSSTFSAGTSGLTPSVPTSGAVTLGLGTTATSAPLTVVSRDANSNMNANNANLGYNSTVTSGGTTTLLATSAATQTFTGTQTQTVLLPDTATLVPGFSLTIINTSTGAVTLQTHSGASLSPAVPVQTGQTAKVYCVSAGGLNTAAEWVATVSLPTNTFGTQSSTIVVSSSLQPLATFSLTAGHLYNAIVLLTSTGSGGAGNTAFSLSGGKVTGSGILAIRNTSANCGCSLSEAAIGLTTTIFDSAFVVLNVYMIATSTGTEILNVSEATPSHTIVAKTFLQDMGLTP